VDFSHVILANAKLKSQLNKLAFLLVVDDGLLIEPAMLEGINKVKHKRQNKLWKRYNMI